MIDPYPHNTYNTCCSVQYNLLHTIHSLFFSIPQQVLSHVKNPVDMLQMAAKCLKKNNGQMIIFDADHAGTVYAIPDFSMMMDINRKLATGIAQQPDICRQMPRYLKESHLKLLNHTSVVLSECGRGDYWLSSVRAFSRIIPAMGLLPTEQGETWTKQMLQSHEDNTFFASGTFFTFYVTRE